jgi:hypothetical protein
MKPTSTPATRRSYQTSWEIKLARGQLGFASEGSSLHKFTGRAEISFEITVRGDVFDGTATARTYDATGTLTDGPTAPGKFEGKRVTYP